MGYQQTIHQKRKTYVSKTKLTNNERPQIKATVGNISPLSLVSVKCNLTH